MQKQMHQLPEEELRCHRCAFTGHRPEKVVGYEGKIIVELRKEILQAIEAGYLYPRIWSMGKPGEWS